MTATILDYNTGDTIRPATNAEVAHYVRLVSAMPASQRDAGAVHGSAIANDLADTVVYMTGVEIPAVEA
jgi:hypothetical protein